MSASEAVPLGPGFGDQVEREEPLPPGDPTQAGVREDTVQIDLPANGSLEYALQMTKGVTLYYDWSTSRGGVVATLYGAPEGDTSGYSEELTVTRGSSVEGSLEILFTGRYGWCWRNENDHPLTVKLNTRGTYTVVGQIECLAGGPGSRARGPASSTRDRPTGGSAS